MIRKHNRVGMTREMILFLREMFAGRKISLGQFPTLVEFFHLDPLAQAFLRLPPARLPDIFVAAAGPKMLELAWNIGDGLIISNLSFPTALVRQGALDLAMTNSRKRAARATTVTVSPKFCTYTYRYRGTGPRRNAAPSQWAPARSFKDIY